MPKQLDNTRHCAYGYHVTVTPRHRSLRHLFTRTWQLLARAFSPVPMYPSLTENGDPLNDPVAMYYTANST